MSAQEVHDAAKATLKPGQYVPAEVKLGGGGLALRYVGPDGYKIFSDGAVWPYDVTILRLLDTRTDDAEWVEVTVREYDEAWRREGKSRVRYTFTRDSDGEWAFVYFIHRDALTPPAPDADLIGVVRFALGSDSTDAAAKALIALVDQHRAKAGERS